MEIASVAGRVALFLALVACAVARAQPVTPLATPHLDIAAVGVVKAILHLPDGSMIVGGDLTSVRIAGLEFDRQHLAKFGPDGSLDFDWLAGADGPVYALALDPSGAIYVAGSFGVVGPPAAQLARKNIARISSTGSGAVDSSWNPDADGSVLALALDTSGALFVGGSFGAVGGLPRLRLAKLLPSGQVDLGWLANASPFSVLALAIDAGSLYAGGGFTSVGGVSTNCLARISVATPAVVDTGWVPGSPGCQVLTLATANGLLYVGGTFLTMGGAPRPNLARISLTNSGQADPLRNPSPNNTVYAISADSSGDIYVGGNFSFVGGEVHTGITKLSGTGTGQPRVGWSPVLGAGVVQSIAAGAAQVQVGGSFSAVNGQLSEGLALLGSSSGSLALPFQIESVGRVSAVARAADDSIYVGGTFSRIGDVVRDNLLKLDSTGALSPSFHPDPNSPVSAIAVDSAGAVYVGGGFGTIGGVSRQSIAKLSSSGMVDPTWNAPITCSFSPLQCVSAIAIDEAGGAVYVGGPFNGVSGTSRAGAARLAMSGTGALDPSWNPGISCALPAFCVSSLAIDQAGFVYVGGDFDAAGGQPRNGLAKFSSSAGGTADPLWNPGTNCPPASSHCVNSIALAPGGSLFVGGSFTNFGGAARSRLAKVSTVGAGAVDPSWIANANGAVNTLAVDGSGELYVGGGFTALDGVARSRLAKVSGAGTGLVIDNWNPGASGDVHTLSVAAAGSLLAGGVFGQIGNEPRDLLAALPTFESSLFASGFE